MSKDLESQQLRLFGGHKKRLKLDFRFPVTHRSIVLMGLRAILLPMSLLVIAAQDILQNRLGGFEKSTGQWKLVTLKRSFELTTSWSAVDIESIRT